MHIEAEGNNELTRLLESMQTMQSHLSGVLTRIQQSTAQVASASSQIAAANLDLSSRTEAQASALEETAASMEEMTASVQQNEQITRSAKDMSQRAAAEAQDVGRLVQEVVAMIQDLHGSSQRMNDIIGVIDGIAFQTNILALNAAVEAARAGEQGRGFAVVAAEVRALAQRSAQAAREIKGILQTNVEKMSQGSELAEKAGGAVVSVVTAIDRVNTTVAEVAMATKEQSEGIDQIGQSVVQLDQATQQNAALVEETSAATSNLDDQVQTLQQQIQGFQIDQRRASAEMVPALPSQSSSRAGVKRLA
jgi:methyl-accepting chemotaxis protein